LDQGEGYYFTSLPDYDVADIKEQTKTVFDLHPASVITIQNVQPISKELFEQKTGKPFFL